MSQQIIREKRLCRTCKGKGKITTDGYSSEMTCPVCDGTKVEIVEIINNYFPKLNEKTRIKNEHKTNL